MGKSRSTTCIIAYLMHKDRNLTPQEALSRLRQVRSICEPNDGFMEQLELYHQMHCPENIDDEPAYQRWLYRREVEMSVACGSAPDNIRFQDEATNAEHDRPGLELRCRKCRYCTISTRRSPTMPSPAIITDVHLQAKTCNIPTPRPPYPEV